MPREWALTIVVLMSSPKITSVRLMALYVLDSSYGTPAFRNQMA